MVVSFECTWHGLKIKAQLFRGSGSIERSEIQCPHCSSLWLVSSKPAPREFFCSMHLDPTTFRRSLRFCLDVWGSVFYFVLFFFLTHFQLGPLSSLLPSTLNSWMCLRRAGGGVDKRHLNGGGKCSGGVRISRSALFSRRSFGVFGQNLQWGRRVLKSRTVSTSAEVSTMVSLRRSF